MSNVQVKDLTAKITPVDADVTLIIDTENSFDNKKITFGDIKTFVNPNIVAGLVVDDQAYATVNTTLIQNALDNAGEVVIQESGIVYIDSVLTVKSNTNVKISAGTTIKVKDTANTGVFTNEAARATPISVAGGAAGEMTWITLADSSYGIRIDKTGIGNTFPLGSVISVVMTGHLTAPGGDTHAYTNGFRGVWDVVASSADSITYQIKRLTPGSGSFAYPPIGAEVYRADENITISGGGTIDGNGANQTLYGAGDPRGNVIWVRNAKNVVIDGLNFKRGRSWTIGSNYVRDYVVQNIGGDVRGGSANDLVHLSGQHQNVVVEKIRAAVGDNTVGLTIDIGDDPANVAYYPQYDFPYQDPGDMFDIVVRDVMCTNTLPFAVCGIYGPVSYKYENITFDNIGGEAASAVQPANYTPTGMNNCRGTKLSVRNLHSTTTGPQLIMSGVQNWDSVIFEDSAVTSLSQEAVKLDNTGTINQFTVRNLVGVIRTSFRSQSLISVGGGTYGSFIVSDIENQKFATNVALFKHTGTGTIGRLLFSNVSATVTTGGASNSICSVTAAGLANSVEFNSCSLTSQGSLGSIFIQSSTANYTTAIFNGCTITNAGALFSGSNTTNTVNVFMNNITLSGTNARAASFAGPTNLFVNGYNELSAPSNNPFNAVTAAKNYFFTFENINRLTDLVQYTAGNLRITGSGARTNGANVNIPQSGDTFWNLNSGVLGGIGCKSYTNGLSWMNLDFDIRSVSIQVTEGTTDVTTGDGKAYFTVPDSFNGMNLIRAQATVVTAGTTNVTTVMIHNKTDAQDMLSGAISIASGGTVGTVGTINTSFDDVATNDVLRIDVDSVSTTAPKGLVVVLEFKLP